jgi:hypothetical protein
MIGDNCFERDFEYLLNAEPHKCKKNTHKKQKIHHGLDRCNKSKERKTATNKREKNTTASRDESYSSLPYRCISPLNRFSDESSRNAGVAIGEDD